MPDVYHTRKLRYSMACRMAQELEERGLELREPESVKLYHERCQQAQMTRLEVFKEEGVKDMTLVLVMEEPLYQEIAPCDCPCHRRTIQGIFRNAH